VIDTVRTAYTALRTQPPPAGDDLAVLALESVPGAYAGIDELARPHLLLAVHPGSPPPAEIATLAIGTRLLVIGGKETAFLDVTCLFEALAEVFDQFVAVVLERQLTSGDSAEAAVTTVLAKWREFLVAGTDPPGRDKLAAVFGELLVVLDAVRSGGPTAVGSWAGPFGGRHDMRGGTTALEVKTTRSHTSRQVTIHGEDQLVPPDGGVLYLHFVRLEQVPGAGRSVSALVDELLTAGAPTEQLFEAITAAGVPVAQLAATTAITFDVRERLTLPVDDQMPRMVPTSFIGGSRPGGVVDISYVIDLDKCLDSALTEQAYTDLLKTVAAQGTTA
jgi:hypothetical protein